MRTMPRTWPSMRFSLLRTGFFVSLCILDLYPTGVYLSIEIHTPMGFMHIEKRTIMKHHGPGAIDPVCGMTVDPKMANHKTNYKGHPYYFCSAGCRTKFMAAPAKYLAASPTVLEPV